LLPAKCKPSGAALPCRAAGHGGRARPGRGGGFLDTPAGRG